MRTLKTKYGFPRVACIHERMTFAKTLQDVQDITIIYWFDYSFDLLDYTALYLFNT